MPNHTVKWTEDDVLSLPLGQNDTFERKGARLLDLTIPTVDENHVLSELAKQLCAFANTGGGRIIYGMKNAGDVDNGGVARSVKGNRSTKEWLEDVIPVLTDCEIIGCNVYEITPKPSNSAIARDKSLYVVDVPESDRAPHQSKRDFIYYVRLGGESQPASHRLIEDIRNRARHPKLEVQEVQIRGANYFPERTGCLRIRRSYKRCRHCRRRRGVVELDKVLRHLNAIRLQLFAKWRCGSHHRFQLG
jgi:hypothetical protein